jgi:hypothetical protein
MPFQKIFPVISYTEFLERVSKESQFTSSRGRRYLITGLIDEVLFFDRLDSARDVEWDINLQKLYDAYITLQSYKTEEFKDFIPRRHSPGRGLLLRLGLIEEVNIVL